MIFDHLRKDLKDLTLDFACGNISTSALPGAVSPCACRNLASFSSNGRVQGAKKGRLKPLAASRSVFNSEKVINYLKKPEIIYLAPLQSEVTE